MATFTGSDKAIAFLFDMVANMADDYDSTSAYSVGDYAVYDGTLYKCTSAISTPEDFTPAHWQAVLVMDEVAAGGGGGGGTTVIANPAGDATDTLKKLQVGPTIYDLPLGGGSFKRTLLWSGVKDAQNDVVPLSEDYDKFDYIELMLGFHSTNAFYNKTFVIPTDSVSVSQVYQFADGLFRQSGTSSFISFSFTAKDEITIDQIAVSGQMAAKIFSVNGIKFEGDAISLASCYSKEERQVGTWLDGKPLYQKTWELSAPVSLTQNAWTQISSITISAYDMEKIVFGVAQSATKETFSALNYSGNTNDRLYIFNAKQASPAIEIKYITLQYTKANDTAGSGTWTPNGERTEHFSTTEHIVGTWIDGKPLYEITLQKSNLGQVTTSTILFLRSEMPANIDKLLDIKTTYIDASGGVWTENTYLNSQSIMVTWLAGSGPDIYRWTQWGSGPTNMTAYCTLRYTKTV